MPADHAEHGPMEQPQRSEEGAPADGAELAALRAIVEGTARATGEEFFQSLVRHLAKAVGTSYAFVAEFAGGTLVRTLAYWCRDRIIDNTEWDVVGTPCEDVVRGQLCHHPTGVSTRFPADETVVEWGIESYLGVPLCDAAGRHLGHLAVFDDRPMPAEPRRLFTFRIFAARAAAELERLRDEQRLRDSEERYRDLYEEAPNAYVSLDLDGKLIGVNRTATRLLGRPAGELVGSLLTDHCADSPAGRPRALAALERLRAGEDVPGIEVQLARPDRAPLWVNLSLRPVRGAGGRVEAGRSIWMDVTARVLAELEQARLEEQNLYLQEEIKSVHNFEEILGTSPTLEAVLAQVRQVAPTDATVLVTGETGTGKELIARAIHSASRRKARPLIKLNCAALPTGLVESELFGHEKGAFTGAIARRLGRFELADGGTIFLDEIGELPADAQAKLLRVLQEREFERIGSSAAIQVDVRVLAATNRDLLRMTREKTFREDLYYRLSVFPLHLPPLRDRREDVPLLVHALVQRFAARVGKRIEAVTEATLRRLEAYPWPGNVRELENVVERAVILATTPVLDIAADLLAGQPAPLGGQAAGLATLEETERSQIESALKQTNWVIEGERGAARILGLHPNTLRSRLKKLGLNRPGHEPS
jgi:PAS domain S-box-containing protein